MKMLGVIHGSPARSHDITPPLKSGQTGYLTAPGETRARAMAIRGSEQRAAAWTGPSASNLPHRGDEPPTIRPAGCNSPPHLYHSIARHPTAPPDGLAVATTIRAPHDPRPARHRGRIPGWPGSLALCSTATTVFGLALMLRGRRDWRIRWPKTAQALSSWSQASAGSASFSDRCCAAWRAPTKPVDPGLASGRVLKRFGPVVLVGHGAHQRLDLRFMRATSASTSPEESAQGPPKLVDSLSARQLRSHGTTTASAMQAKRNRPVMVAAWTPKKGAKTDSLPAVIHVGR